MKQSELTALVDGIAPVISKLMSAEYSKIDDRIKSIEARKPPSAEELAPLVKSAIAADQEFSERIALDAVSRMDGSTAELVDLFIKGLQEHAAA